MAPGQIRPKEISFIGTGDCGPVHGPADGFPIERYTELVRPVLQSVDLRFANCERQYSSRGIASKTSPHGRQPPEMAQPVRVGHQAARRRQERHAGMPELGQAAHRQLDPGRVVGIDP